jgi:hypothetical protein
MRYLEYIYLIFAGLIAAYIATEYRHLSTFAFVGLCLAAGLMGFMYSFRRNQRHLLEKMEREQPYPDEEEDEEVSTEPENSASAPASDHGAAPADTTDEKEDGHGA